MEKQGVVSFCDPAAALILETVFEPNARPPLKFAVSRAGKIDEKMQDFYELPDKTRIKPPGQSDLIEKQVVLLPSQPQAYTSRGHLLADLVSFIHRYVAVNLFWELLIAH